MTPSRALFLGVLQGFGEFLPISSSGHLIVVPWLFGWPDSGLSFDVALHLGTLAAVAAAFWRDWWRMMVAFSKALPRGRVFQDREARRLVFLGLASIPGAGAGLLLDEWAETVFRAPWLVALMMTSMGVVLWAADRRGGEGRRGEDVTLGQALVIGLAQALAIVPGTSRSGATISAALFLGHGREAAARFSFLLALPITAGAALVKVPHLFHAGAETGPVMAGMLVAAVSGFLAIRLLLRHVRTHDYLPFALYRFVFSALVLGVFFWRQG